MSPQTRKNCQKRLITIVPETPTISSVRLPIITRRAPKRSSSQPLTGDAMPNSSRFTLITEAIAARLHPNSISSG